MSPHNGCAQYTEDEGADESSVQSKRHLSAIRVTACRAGDRAAQSETPWIGQLLSDGQGLENARASTGIGGVGSGCTETLGFLPIRR